LGLENHIIQSDKLKGKSGAIQSVINIEVPSLGYVEYINIIPNGLNAILPNLDMVFVASNSCAMENLPFSFDNPWRQYLYDDYTKSLLNAAAFLYHQAPGLPFHSHSLFLKHRIDSITLQVVSSPYNTNYEFFRFARSLEAILRSLNNLIERFHHSEFFYFNTAPTAFLSIGQYSPCFALLLAPLVLSVSRENRQHNI
jgi:glycosylphosphatidylinositol transamidase